MTGTLQPLDQKFPIVDAEGKPTLYFTQWAQQKQIDIGKGITLQDLQDFLTEHKLAEGLGIALTPSGDINDSPSIAIRNGVGLNFDAMHNLKLADTAVAPGTYGDATHVAQVTVDQQGRITAVALVAITGGGGGGNWWAGHMPLAADFPLLIGTAHVTLSDDVNVGLCVDGGAPITGDVQRAALKALPAAGTDFTLTVRMTVNGWDANFGGAGIYLWDATGAAKTVGFLCSIQATPFKQVTRFNYPAGFNSNPFAQNDYTFHNWMRIQRVGTNLTFFMSKDGKKWITCLTESQTAWLANAPSHIGPGIWYNRAAGQIIASVDYWVQTW